LRSGRICTLCEFTLETLPAILAIERKASSAPWSEQNFRDSINSSHLCVGVTSDGAWLAHAVFSLGAGEAELLILAVDPKFQRQKIASLLMTNMESFLRAFTTELFLEVRCSNHSAIQLYESLGYSCLGERPNYYPALNGREKRENALIFGKHIDVNTW